MAIYMYRPEKIRKIPRKENHTEFWKLFNMLLTPFKKTQGLFFFGTDGVYHTISETTAKKFPLERKKKKKEFQNPSQRQTIPIATYSSLIRKKKKD
jgi:hypothetical protein